MDDLVVRAMARWPGVPAMFGWLRLDRRGNWYLIDRGHPGFDEARDGAGSPITSEPIIDFIHRNYGHDEQGRWFWQNGPQRVFVDLDCAPLVLRVLGEPAQARFVAHTGYLVSSVESAWFTADGSVLLATDIGPGVVHDLDLASLALSQAADGDISLLVGDRCLRLQPTDCPARSLGFVSTPRS
jgi:hypothetical protein